MGSSHGSGATDTDAIPRRIAQLEEIAKAVSDAVAKKLESIDLTVTVGE